MSSTSIYHYVYRITNILESKHYYGKRSSKIEPRLDIGIKYFSSSSDKPFKQDQKDNPQNYKYKIVKIFSDVKDALIFESKLHFKFDVGRNPNFYNKVKQTPNGFDTTGTTQSQIMINQISNTMKKRVAEGVVFTPEHRANLSKGSKGKPKSRDQIIKGQQTKTLYGIQKGKNHPRSKYIYVTPLGETDSPKGFEDTITMSRLKDWCKRCDRIISFKTYKTSEYLSLNYAWEDIQNKTFKELGFYTKSSQSY